MNFTLAKENLNFLPRFYRLSFVSILSNVMVPLAGLCDTAFLGHLKNIQPLAGVILASILFDYLYRILKFLRNSTNAITSQAVGQDDPSDIILAGLRSSLIAIAISLVILLFQYPIQKLGFAILSSSPAIEASGIEYFNARIWGAPAVLLNLVLIGWFLGREKNGSVLLISIIANGFNAFFDYLMIYRWGWESAGAGIATACSQYLALLVGLVIIGFSINWQDAISAVKRLWDRQALRNVVSLNLNILVRFITSVSAYSIFTNISAGMGTNILTENGLLLQISLLGQFIIQGFGLTTQTLIGNFKGKGEFNNMMPLLTIAIASGSLIALGFSTSVILFPQTIFGILTNHTEINQEVVNYSLWLMPLITFSAIAYMLEGYFIGLKKGVILRNASLATFILVFLPLVTLALYRDSVNLLWFSLVSYMLAMAIILAVQIFSTQASIQINPTNESIEN